ncbi:MAG TPA: SGNH/GDSL hydrolase family protein [Thermoguttaceae bacterium]|nr:SGNH/GDSL hydrolase family protein [Thermoguttaceae bacterium]
MKRCPALKAPLRLRIQIGALLSCVFLFGGLGSAGKAYAQEAATPARKAGTASATPQSDAKGKTESNPLETRKILFLGNSITLHGPAPAIGWLGNWGMAASAQEKDFVHLVTSSLSRATGTAREVMVKNIADFERQYATCDVDEKLKDQFAFGADLVILAIGENVPNLDSEEAKSRFGNSLMKLLRGLKADHHPTIVVRSCFWPNQAKDQILKQACQEVGGIFVDIGSLGKDESNYARSERKFAHGGVAAHPGDQGMQAIADAILDAINNQRGKETE